MCLSTRKKTKRNDDKLGNRIGFLTPKCGSTMRTQESVRKDSVDLPCWQFFKIIPTFKHYKVFH